MSPYELTSRALRHHWWIALLILLISLGATALLTAAETPIYRGESTWVVTPIAEIEDATHVMRALESLERRTVVATFARIATTRDIRAAVEERLGMEEYALSDYRIGVSVVPYTNLIRFEVQGPEREVAARAVGALARETRNEALGMYRIYILREFEESRAGSRPVHPDWRRNLAVAVVVGLFLGLSVALSLAVLRSPSRVES